MKTSYLLLQYVASVALARALGPEAFGAYTFAVAMVLLMVICVQLGFPNYLVRMVTLYRLNGDERLQKGLLLRAAQIVLVASLITSATAGLVITNLDLTKVGIRSSTLLLALPILPFLALLETNGGALRGLGHIYDSQFYSQCLRPALFLILLWIAISQRGSALSPEDALVVSTVATAVALAFALSGLRHRLPTDYRNRIALFHTMAWARGAFPFLLLSGAQVVNYQTGILMLGIMSGPEQVGLYRVAVQVADALSLVLIAVTIVISPHIARLHATSDWPAIQRLVVLGHRAGVAVLLPLALLIFAGGVPLLVTVFGPEYSSSFNAMLILAFGKVGYAAVCLSAAVLSMCGMASVASLGSALSALINLGLHWLLIPIMGIEGAALATTFSSIVLNAGLAIWIWKKYKTNVSFTARLQQRELS